MQIARRTVLAALSAMIATLAVVLSLIGDHPAYAAHRPFPKYELTYQKIIGHKDPNHAPGDPGDGCLRVDDPQLVPLHYFAFSTMLDSCDGIRTTVRWYYDEPFEPDEESTLQFRWGVTWQYWVDGSDELFLKPIENFTYDGEPVSKEQYDPDNPAVLDENGNPKRMGNGQGMYEPIHWVFESEFGETDEHTMQFDVYMPSDAVGAGMSWGTGSTGDTQGGSIGATAQGIYASLPAKMDFRYVLHSEYLAARGFGQDEVLQKALDYGPGLPERKWATAETGIADSTFELIECLESSDQQLAQVRSSIPINQIYPELPHSTPALFEDAAGNPGFARWPYQFSVYQNGNWDPRKGLRVMNRINGSFAPYYNADGSLMALPYKPHIETLIEDIPGYEYVDNDITVVEKGKFDVDQPEHSLNFLTAPNVLLRTIGQHNTQHFYYTYRPIPGTFELEKSVVSFVQDDESGEDRAERAPLSGAKFKLFEVVDDQPTACGLTPDLTDTEMVEVCTQSEPMTTAELQQASRNTGTCQSERLRAITLEGTDGTFTTDADGKFTPAGKPALAPGKYVLQEVAAPANHAIVNEWIPFEIPLQAGDDAGVVHVAAANYELGTFELVKTGVDYQWDDESEAYVKSQTPLGGARFELYQPANDASEDGVEEVTVCDYRTPASAEELQEMLADEPTGCQSQLVRKVALPGVDGAFETDADGKFTPEGDPSLLPGEYFLHESAAPGDYQVLNEWVRFEIDGGTTPVEVFAENYLQPTPPEETPPPTPPEETPPSTPPASTPPTEDPGKPGIPLTGSDGMGNALAALVLAGAGMSVLVTRRIRLA